MTSSNPMDGLPGPAKRILHFFWLVDVSESMRGGKIATIDRIIPEVLPLIKAAAEANLVEVKMRAIRFSDTAAWMGDSRPVDIDSFHWTPQTLGPATATAKAIRLLAEALIPEMMPQKRGAPPICILLSDGFCTDSEVEFEAAIKALDAQPWGKKAIRLAIGIGQESEYDEKQLARFVNHPEVGVLKADSPSALVQYIKWVSTVVKNVTAPQSNNKGDAGTVPGNVILPSPPPPASANGPSVW